MANSVWKGNERVLRCSNGAMDVFHEILVEVVCEQGLEHDAKLAAFVESLDQEMHGRGLACPDIEEYFGDGPEKMPLSLLGRLIEKVIEKYKISDYAKGEYRLLFIGRLENFRIKILYAGFGKRFFLSTRVYLKYLPLRMVYRARGILS